MTITDTHVFFYTNYLSNWWSTRDIRPQFTDPITGLTWNNTEEAFMWYKANFFGDVDTCYNIATHAAARGHPRDVKAMGRQVMRYDDKAWLCVRLGYMTYVNLLKYQQNPELAAQLRDTGDRVLVEASPVDCVWGIGLSEQDAAAGLPWKGQNLLGQALMTVRGLI